MANNNFESGVFGEQLRRVEIAGAEETVMFGGNRDFSRLGDALDGVQQVAVIGWSSQGPAQAQNLRESFRDAALTLKLWLVYEIARLLGQRLRRLGSI